MTKTRDEALRAQEVRIGAALATPNPDGRGLARNPNGIGRTGAHCGVACPTCGEGAPVLDSRSIPEGRWRRRRCPAGHRFSTLEKVYVPKRGWFTPPVQA